jgi:hypothetical protein
MDAFLEELSDEAFRRATFYPMPARWAAFAAKHALVWTHIPFDAAHRPDVPNEPGLYCFLVGLPPAALPPLGYPLYVGKTDRQLRTRFREYLSEKDDPGGRKRVRKILTVFQGELFFSCAPFAGSAEDRKAIETELHDALMPPYSDIGFTAEVRRRRQAFP